MDMKMKIIVTGGILILLAFLLVIGLGQRGALDLYQLRLERDRLRAANVALHKENEALYGTIDRLKKDLDYVEAIARRELGMAGKDEMVILKKKR